MSERQIGKLILAALLFIVALALTAGILFAHLVL